MNSLFFGTLTSAVTAAVYAGLLLSVTSSMDSQPRSMLGTKIPQAIAVTKPAENQDPASYSVEALNKLVAPIALYADPLLAQALPASTYPTEVVQASHWLRTHRGLKGEELEASIGLQQWAPSVKALCSFQEILEFMDSQVEWTTQLGNAVLSREQDVLDAIQRMRAFAYDAGTLQSNDKQIVGARQIGDRRVVSIRPQETELIYVPVYDPGVVYYPPHNAGREWAADQIGFGFGITVPARFYDWDCDWNHGLIVFDPNHYRLWHRQISWNSHDWDHFDWRSATLNDGGATIDVAQVEIDNIDINRRDWRHTDLKRFDWNQIDWRQIDFAKLGFGTKDWKDIDWAAAGIKHPVLVKALREYSNNEREGLRQRLEKAYRNQRYKDRLANARDERILGEKAPEIYAARWAHNPEHRRGLAYAGAAKELFAKSLVPGRREGAAETTNKKPSVTTAKVESPVDGFIVTQNPAITESDTTTKRRSTASSSPYVIRRTMRWANYPPAYLPPGNGIRPVESGRRYANEGFGTIIRKSTPSRANPGQYSDRYRLPED